MSMVTKSSTSHEYYWHSAAADHTQVYLLRTLSKWLPDQVSPHAVHVLDLGCGNGWFSGWLHDRGYAVTGVDPSPSGIEQARSQHPAIRFECFDPDPSILSQLKTDPLIL